MLSRCAPSHGMHLELPGVGQLVEDQPGPEVGAAEIEVALDPGDVRLDEVERALRARCAAGSSSRVSTGSYWPEHAPRHQAEQLADVAVQHAAAHARSRATRGPSRGSARRGRAAAAPSPRLASMKPTAIERDEPRIRGQRHLADLGHQRRDPRGHLGVRGLERLGVECRAARGITGSGDRDPADVLPVDQAAGCLRRCGRSSTRADRMAPAPTAPTASVRRTTSPRLAGLMLRSYGWTAARPESTSRSRTARRCTPDAREACPRASRRRDARRSSRAPGGTARRGSAVR